MVYWGAFRNMINTLSQVYATLNEAPVITLQFMGNGFDTLSVNNEVYSHLQDALNQRIVLSARVDIRVPETLISDWSLTLDVKGLVFQEDKVQITASANDILNCEFPKLRYTALNFPGLKYIS